jgi:Arc/MetJ-type ribon-helix-helix transcriptional regulator
MSSKKPINLTLHERVLTFAENLMELGGYSSVSGLVETLIREEYERRHGPITMHDQQKAAAPPPRPPVGPVSYRPPRRRVPRTKPKHN